MDKIIRPGGSNPIQIKTWQDEIQVLLLEALYDGYKTKEGLLAEVRRRLNVGRLKKTYGHSPTDEEIKNVLVRMSMSKFVVTSRHVCECCNDREFASDNIEHTASFALTAAGRERIPKYVLSQTLLIHEAPPIIKEASIAGA
jgi:hypothetical protein